MEEKKKICGKCQNEKSLSEFNKNKEKKDGYGAYCKECNQLYQKKHYSDNKIEYIVKKNNRKKTLKEFVDGIKKNSKCSYCPENDIACLDFHHIDNNEKDFNIGEAITRGLSVEKIQEEIHKCVVLCSNCHRKHHYYEKTPFRLVV